jgi:hypothetical protein
VLERLQYYHTLRLETLCWTGRPPPKRSRQQQQQQQQQQELTKMFNAGVTEAQAQHFYYYSSIVNVHYVEQNNTTACVHLLL